MAWYKTLQTVQAYRKLFLNEHGQLKPEAKTVLDDLYKQAAFFRDDVIDPQRLAFLEGGRYFVRHIVKKLKIKQLEIDRHLKKEIYEDE